jgi:hypothetical protein
MYTSSAFRFSASFVRGASSIRSHTDPLSDAQLMRATPSVFAPAAHDSRSSRYAYIPTIDVLTELRREGFQVFSATQARARTEDRRLHTKHLLRLRHASQFGVSAIDSTPEIVLLNSHDGSSSYQMMGGMFRYVCANGLIVPDGICQTVKVQHSGQVRAKVVQGAFEVLDGLTRVVDSRDAMRAVRLSDDESRALARAALQIRFDLPEGAAAPVTDVQALRARRSDDQASDLWTTFNRLQENVIRGGLAGRTAVGTRQRTRAVTGIDQDVRLNRALWTLADEMRRLKDRA